jgi:hypothetical protein
VLKTAVHNARLGREDALGALERLDAQARQIERRAAGASVETIIAEERAQSHAYGGRSVFGWEEPPASSSGDAGSGQIVRQNFRSA